MLTTVTALRRAGKCVCGWGGGGGGRWGGGGGRGDTVVKNTYSARRIKGDHLV